MRGHCKAKPYMFLKMESTRSGRCSREDKAWGRRSNGKTREEPRTTNNGRNAFHHVCFLCQSMACPNVSGEIRDCISWRVVGKCTTGSLLSIETEMVAIRAPVAEHCVRKITTCHVCATISRIPSGI